MILMPYRIAQILSAVLNKYYSFTEPFSPTWTFWYVREASTAFYVANIPLCWSLLRRVFHLSAFSGMSSLDRSRSRSARVPPLHSGVVSRPAKGNVLGNAVDGRSDDVELGKGNWWDREAVDLEGSDNEECILQDKITFVPLEICGDTVATTNRKSVIEPQVVTFPPAVAIAAG